MTRHAITWLAVFAAALLGVPAIGMAVAADAKARPNILWLTSEDHGPHMGCYGDTFATTPNVDALAARGMIYLHCWSNAAGLCAGADHAHLRHVRAFDRRPSTCAAWSRIRPASRCFRNCCARPATTAPTTPKRTTTSRSPARCGTSPAGKAHWRNRAGRQPFFAVFNSGKSHESQIRKRPHEQVHDPAKVRLPAYHPDTPEVRQDWAQYYDTISEADADAGGVWKSWQPTG